MTNVFAASVISTDIRTGRVTLKESGRKASTRSTAQSTWLVGHLCPALQYRFRLDDQGALASWTPEAPSGAPLTKFLTYCGVLSPRTVVRDLDSETVRAKLASVLRAGGQPVDAVRKVARWLPDGFVGLSEHLFDTGASIKDIHAIHALLVLNEIDPSAYVRYLAAHAYQIADGDGVDVPFALLDRLAVEASAEDRTIGAVICALVRGERRGNTASSWGKVIGTAARMADVDRNVVYEAVQDQCNKDSGRVETISCDGTAMLSRKVVAIRETRVARGMVTQATRPLRKRLPANNLSFDGDQQRVADAIRRHSLSVICGAAGTGKTHTVRQVVAAAEQAGLSVAWTATTGRASKVLAGTKGVTLHSFLQVTPGDPVHRRTEPVSVLVVDEASMLDSALAAPLGTFLHDGLATRTVLVGDPYQLPPVGAGKVLADLRESPPPSTAVVELDTIRRTDHAGILALASAIRRGAPAEDVKGLDVRTEPLGTSDDLDRIVAIAGVADNQTMVIAPRKGGPVGVIALNRALRDAHLGPAPDQDWLVGERVVQARTVKTDDGPIVNGTYGIVTGIDGDSVTVAYEDGGPTVVWPQRLCLPGDGGVLLPAYALTIHKAQGSQKPRVIVVAPPTDEGRSPWEDPAMGYTAVTRAVNDLIIFGDPTDLLGDHDSGVQRRTTTLPERMGRSARKRGLL